MKPLLSVVIKIVVVGTGAMTVCGCGQAPLSASAEREASIAQPATGIYVVQDSVNDTSVLQFAAASNGDAAPVSTLTLPPSGPSSVATDASGSIYVGSAADDSISVYSAGSKGADGPKRKVLGSDQSFSYPYLMAVDSVGSLYVSDGAPCACVAVFSNTAEYETAPLRLIKGNLTQINDPLAIAIDGAGNLYVASRGLGRSRSEGQIEVFAPDATGNEAPLRVITGSEGAPFLVSGMTIDTHGDLYVNQGPRILVYEPGAEGGAAPLKTIIPPTSDRYSSQLQVDAIGNLYVMVLEKTDAGTEARVAVYPATASGRASPQSTLKSTAWNNTGFGFALR
jgi:hypothetical protein